MSSESINPIRFAEALKELPSESLALKVVELRNSIAHLDYSNAELKPYAEGRAPTLDQQQDGEQSAQPDQDCIDAIAENEGVITRMQERIELIRKEVEDRGLSWREFQGKPDQEEGVQTDGDAAEAGGSSTNGVNGHAATSGGEAEHPAWRDGTFQTGTLGQLGPEERELLRQLESRMPPDDDEDPDGGMHL